MNAAPLSPLLHIVRRYGEVGGMERYVWELTLQLREQGFELTVLCQRCYADKPRGIKVVELGEVMMRPRWLASLRFSYRVAKWLKNNPQPGVIMHSNERVGLAGLTTIHGPPFASVRHKSWWKRISLRVWVQLWLERRELRNARVIVPNSQLIKAQIARYYPEYAHKLSAPLVPGVTAGALREMRRVPHDGGVIGFVGQEWQRKGLAWAVQIAAALRCHRPKLKLIVLGAHPQEVAGLFAGWPKESYELAGWTACARYPEFDVLLHPARAEPYGMVIVEAMAAGVPVVISDSCGAKAQVNAEAGTVLSLEAPLSSWCAEVEQQLQRTTPAPQFVRGWDVVAREHVALYRDFLCGSR